MRFTGYRFEDRKELLCDWTCEHLSPHRIIYRIPLEKAEHKKITVFPADSKLCAISGMVVFTDLGTVEIRETNGTKIQNDYFFSGAEPFFCFALNGKEKWLELQVNVVTFDSDAFAGIFSEMLHALNEKSALENSNDRLMKINQMNQNSIRDLKAKVAQLTVETEQLRRDKDAVLNSTFWRMTKPLRRAADVLKRVRRKEKKMLPVIRETITSFSGICLAAKGRYDIVLEDVLKGYDGQEKKKVLLSTHELELTGAPVAVVYFAEMLKANNFLPVVISPRHGRLEEECRRYEIPVIVEESLYGTGFYTDYAHLFDAVVANTIVSAPLINALKDTGIPVLWWIHEAEVSWQDENFMRPMPQHLPANVTVYTVGDYAKKMLKKYRPLFDSKELFYFIPEFTCDLEGSYTLPADAKGKKVFCIVGLQEYRKGQDILADAIRELSPKELQQAYFIFVGKKCHPLIYKSIEEIVNDVPNNAVWIEELSRSEISQMYEQIDCLVCASRDDPMPIVATEALQHGKMLICSENTGTAAIVEKEQCGLVYRNNSPRELADAIRTVLAGNVELAGKDLGNQIYQKYFSREVFEKHALEAMKEVLSVRWGAKARFAYPAQSFEHLLDQLDKEKEYRTYTVYNEGALLQYDSSERKRILLISHELSLTGAPIVLHMLAKSLKKQGYDIVVISPYDGPLRERILEDDIPVLVYPHLYSSTFIQQFAESFQLIVANTVVTFRTIYQLENSKVPIIWWIHDSEASYEVGGFADCMIDQLPEQVHIYCDKKNRNLNEIEADLMREEIFDEEVVTLVKKYILGDIGSINYLETVSVIVPTYNAGEQFEQFIQLVKEQRRIKNVELIVVDSGSTDGTVELCQKHGVMLKQISNQEFTHSYARNLGASLASGEVFVFMTQDALPVGDEWLYNIIYPVITGEAAAVSARELCPENTELFYKVSTRGYAKFLNTLYSSQLNRCDGTESIDELRRKASLTDIASAISAPIFRKYQYRYDYAEDLDMGIRLLQDGYRVKILSDVRVLHGHNRNAGYYVRRGFVEYCALGKILPGFVENCMDSRIIATKIVSASEAIYKTMKQMDSIKKENCMIDEYVEKFIDFLHLNGSIDILTWTETSFNDEIFDQCIDICRKICIGVTYSDWEIIDTLTTYIKYELQSYFKANAVYLLDETLEKEIKDCVVKQFAICAGALLSRAEYDNERVFELQSLMTGV